MVPRLTYHHSEHSCTMCTIYFENHNYLASQLEKVFGEMFLAAVVQNYTVKTF